jgi:hypothetical protein
MSGVVTLVAMIIGYVYGMYVSDGDVAKSLSMVVLIGILGVLEVSLSFDNAIVNAKVIKEMDEKWQKRFVTWGMVIAVFGMRVMFPVSIVAVIGHMGFFEAGTLAFSNPVEYSRVLSESHIDIAGFGGAFLLLVALGFFFDAEKDVHWIRSIEKHLAKAGAVGSSEIIVTLSVLIGFAFILPVQEQEEFLLAGVFGIIAHKLVKGLGDIMESGKDVTMTVAKTGLASFLYLEVLDASFSFDGVIGAFVITNDIVIIALGLGIGAMFVRSLTLMFVAKDTLTEFKYLEHGAFWSILSLAIIMFTSTLHEIPEIVTGGLAALLIGASLVWSIIKKEAEED